MAQLWHYACHGQERGPVSSDELRQLTLAGEIGPNDLVWTDGMREWVRLGSVEEFRPRLENAFAVTAAPPRLLPPSPLPRLPVPTATVVFDEEQPLLAEEVPEPRYERRAPQRSRMPVALIAGGVSVLSFLVAFGLSRVTTTPPLHGSYNWSLTTNRQEIWEIKFLEGHRVRLAVNSDGVSDMDLYVYLGETLIEKDDDFSSNCRVTFVARKTATYRVKVWNRFLIPDPIHRNGPNSGVLTYSQVDETTARRPADGKADPEDQQKADAVAQDEQALPDAPAAAPQPPRIVAPPPNEPAVKAPVVQPKPKAPAKPVVIQNGPQLGGAAPAADVDIFDNLPNKAGSKNSHGVVLQANVRYVIDLQSNDFDTVLQLNDSKGRRLAFNDDIGNGNLNSQIVFQPRETATYQLVVRAFGFAGNGAYRLTVSRPGGN